MIYEFYGYVWPVVYIWTQLVLLFNFMCLTSYCATTNATTATTFSFLKLQLCPGGAIPVTLLANLLCNFANTCNHVQFDPSYNQHISVHFVSILFPFPSTCMGLWLILTRSFLIRSLWLIVVISMLFNFEVWLGCISVVQKGLVFLFNSFPVCLHTNSLCN